MREVPVRRRPARPAPDRGFTAQAAPASPGLLELRQGDILTIGRSKLMFVPFCGALHSWEAQD